MGSNHRRMLNRRDSVDHVPDRNTDQASLGAAHPCLVGGLILVFIPYAVCADIALHTVSSTVVGHAGHTDDSGNHGHIEHSEADFIQFQTSRRLGSMGDIPVMMTPG